MCPRVTPSLLLALCSSFFFLQLFLLTMFPPTSRPLHSLFTLLGMPFPLLFTTCPSSHFHYNNLRDDFPDLGHVRVKALFGMFLLESHVPLYHCSHPCCSFTCICVLFDQLLSSLIACKFNEYYVCIVYVTKRFFQPGCC